MWHIVVVGLGGFLGAIARYAVSGWVCRVWGSLFPYGTLVVNLIGCFGLGFVLTLTEERFLMHPEWRSFLAIGVFVAFTTFSTFSYETLVLLREGSFLAALTNMGTSVLAGLLAVYLGMIFAKLI
ncbi:MAG: fluoride efflux transporter CrcB [candidate division KSB1 bacterium]|nr:fluoride efflux transporter CrcB [candidate division KSB1 bacterium]